MTTVEISKNTLSDHTVASLQEAIAGWDMNPHHASRILKEYYRSGGRVDFAALKVGHTLEAKLRDEIELRQSTTLSRNVSADGTVKFLLGLQKGGAVESVLMDSATPGRAAGCVSSQIGCAMGCDFCASTKRGLERNLEAGEIVEQFLQLRAEALSSGRQLRTLVFMGMGEPMQNYDNVVSAVERIAGEDLGEFGWRQICISTVGIVPGIDRLADEDRNVVLALSLHAPDDETRSRIVPMNRRYPVAEIMAATRRYADKTGRIPNIEYCVLNGINDSDRPGANAWRTDARFSRARESDSVQFDWHRFERGGVQPAVERAARFVYVDSAPEWRACTFPENARR